MNGNPRRNERRQTDLSAEQMEAIAQRAADIAEGKIFEKIGRSVATTLLSKIFMIAAGATFAGWAYLKAQGYIK